MESSVSNQSSEYIIEMRSPEDPSGRSARALKTVVGGVDLRSLSFDALKEIPVDLLKTNQDAVHSILSHKKDTWNNPQLFELVEEYFGNSLQMSNFCTALENCLERACDKQLIISLALQRFEEEEKDISEIKIEKYSKTLENLNRFKIAEDTFTEEFFRSLKTVQQQHLSMLKKLRLRNSKISKKLNYVKTWRKPFKIIFAITCVAFAIWKPHIAGVLAVVAAVLLGPMEKWFDWLWNRYQVLLEGQRELLSSMEAQTFIAGSDLDGIKALVDRLEMQFESLTMNADFALRGEDRVKFGIDEIKKNRKMFMQSLKDLVDHASKCREQREEGWTVMLQKIIIK